MNNKMMWVLRILAIVGILGFFLPYCMVSCSSEQATFSASDLAIGTEIFDQKIEAQPLVWLLAFIPVAMLILAFACKTIHSKGFWFLTILESIGALWVNGEVRNQIAIACGEYNVMYEMQIGYTLIQLFGIMGLIFAVVIFLYVSGLLKKIFNQLKG